jgi:hypothetical protein
MKSKDKDLKREPKLMQKNIILTGIGSVDKVALRLFNRQ